MIKKTLLCLAAIGMQISCSDETTIFSNPQDDISIESSQSVLENSILYDKSGVLDIYEENSVTGKFSLGAKSEIAGDYPLTLVAQINPPSYGGGESLTASHIHLVDNYAYVSYNTVGANYAGGIDIINIKNPNKPKITSRLYYTNADINSLKYENGYVYAVGGVDSEKSVRATSNSFIAKISASNGKFNLSAGISYGFQEGFNGTDIALVNNTIMVTSGMDGSLTVYDKNSIEILKEVPFEDLRSLASKDNNIALLDASKGILLLDQNLNITKEIDIDSDFGPASKRTIAFFGDKIVVSEGTKGAGVYDTATGSLLEYIPILLNPEGVSNQDVVTNAVTTNQKVILMANGGAGLCLSEENNNNSDLVGIIELDGSINYVESKGDYIFAASGRQGLQIIKLNRPDESLVSRCASLTAYQGNRDLLVQQGQVKEYRGAKRFNRITVNGSLLLCGSWTTSNSNYINSNALFEMNGTLVVGRNNKRKNITVDEGATFRVEGNLTIYGDLILKDGATIEFIGNSSVVNIFGKVKKSGTVEVKGTFDDVRDRF
ncbi:MAG: hypothetical protein QM485_09945 [Flavobacteriaceae bacterium]